MALQTSVGVTTLGLALAHVVQIGMLSLPPSHELRYANCINIYIMILVSMFAYTTPMFSGEALIIFFSNFLVFAMTLIPEITLGGQAIVFQPYLVWGAIMSLTIMIFTRYVYWSRYSASLVEIDSLEEDSSYRGEEDSCSSAASDVSAASYHSIHVEDEEDDQSSASTTSSFERAPILRASTGSLPLSHRRVPLPHPTQ